MFERFTTGSRAVLVEAQDLALELGSRHIGVGHVLYGCAEGGEETAGVPLHACGITPASVRRSLPRTDEGSSGPIDPEALRAIGIDYADVRAAVEDTFGAGALGAAPDRRVPSGRSRRPPFTPEAKRSLELAVRAAQELHHNRMVPGHLLLGLLRLDNEFVSKTVEQAGATVAGLSAAVFTSMAPA